MVSFTVSGDCRRWASPVPPWPTSCGVFSATPSGSPSSIQVDSVSLSSRARHTSPNGIVPEKSYASGIPSALQGLFRNGSNVLYMKLVAMTVNPTVALTAYSIGRQMGHTVRRTSLSFGTTTTSVVGRSLGAKDPEGANARGWTTLVLSVGILSILGLPFFFLADVFMSVFTDEAAVIAVGIPYLYAIAVAEPFMCSAIATQGTLRAVFSAMQAFSPSGNSHRGEWRHRKL